MTDTPPTNQYIGRFAPSPSGPLHFGSLIAALASFLDARAHQGIWLVRMEDLDPDREPSGTADTILRQLSDYGMESDYPVLLQSTRLKTYQEALNKLESMGLCFNCTCSRQDVRAMGNVYDGTCRDRQEQPAKDFAIRLRVDDRTIHFDDLIQGARHHSLCQETGDFVIKRKDGLFAYQLAVVVDDAFQQVTHVVRGFDLIDSTPRQIYLQSRLGLPHPCYAHVPVAVNRSGQKLSKQHFARSIDSGHKESVLYAALQFLGLHPHEGIGKLPLAKQLDWAIKHWDIQAIPKLATIPQHIVLD